MMKLKTLITLVVFVGLFMTSCKKNDDDIPVVATVELNNPINDFVWKGMNSWYNWQPYIANLDNAKEDNIDDYYTYLNSYSTPESLFESLLHNDDANRNTGTPFSWFIEDYNEQGASFRGVNDAYGFEFGLARLCSDCNEIIGYVTYVVPNSPASDAGLNRGDMFYKFDGVELNVNNYRIVNNYYDADITSIALSFNTINNDEIIPTNVEKSLAIREVVENPVLYSNIITTEGGKKVGYLVYNGFKYTFHSELNDAFGDFKTNGIDELVLDLRYNGGGSVLTSAYLASMIYGAAPEDEVFAKLIYNDNHSDESGYYPFFDTAYIYNKEGEYTDTEVTLNRLNNLTRVYIITSDDTASASEMVINGLSPFMSVIKIGTTTYGKNVGSITLYDSPDFTSENVNSSHTNAMQPIVFQIYNKLDESDYTLGFEPDHEVFERASEIKPFGDIEEPLLKTALDLISGLATKQSLANKRELRNEKVFSSLKNKKFSKEMYVLPEIE
ncbi:S41 family peptidase [uncultured Lutibacter sp.]|uniref:S41 family peptidase n=1 Tax=uncultured Lutibacter sp. TaxID=437739 RepID=UPI00260E7395|nr:S41 family peptidase [uncultured Lutibacter sp.]